MIDNLIIIFIANAWLSQHLLIDLDSTSMPWTWTVLRIILNPIDIIRYDVAADYWNRARWCFCRFLIIGGIFCKRMFQYFVIGDFFRVVREVKFNVFQRMVFCFRQYEIYDDQSTDQLEVDECFIYICTISNKLAHPTAPMMP